jgi:hypothetical protein
MHIYLGLSFILHMSHTGCVCGVKSGEEQQAFSHNFCVEAQQPVLPMNITSLSSSLVQQ